MSWRIYYDDGTTSDNCVTDPWRVVCIVQPRPTTGREIVRMYPYYLLLKDNRWRPSEDVPSLLQQVIYNLADIDTVVMGIWTDDANFEPRPSL